MTTLVIAIVAFVAGAVNSIAGGGTFLTFPTLTGVGRLSEKIANMTSTIGLWPGSAAGVVAATPEFKRLPRPMVIGYGVISLLGGIAGSLLLLQTSTRTFRLVIPWLLAFATIVFAFSKPIARWAGRKHGDRSLKWTLFVGLVQLVVAIYGGYFGAGIGVLMLAGLSFAGLDDIHQMNALKVLLATIINGVAAAIFLLAPVMMPHRPNVEIAIDWPVALLMAVASSVGGFLGMAYARKIKPTSLRLGILAIGVILTGVYFAKAYLR
jgi:uncharacterized membrane protein YfcA